LKQIRSKLTYANVISTLCLFLLVGGGTAFAAQQMLSKNSVGTKQIKNNAITAAKIKNGAVTGAKVNLGSLGTVPTATHASAADSATKATTATNAEQLGGTAASGYAKTQLEGLHVIGASGQPPFLDGCGSTGFFQPPAFYKDPYGVVHLLGDIAGCTAANTNIFVLPAGFRPLISERYVIRKGDATTGTIRIEANGEVAIFEAKEGSLTGIQFRTN
jgi:hypothetical protein